ALRPSGRRSRRGTGLGASDLSNGDRTRIRKIDATLSRAPSAQLSVSHRHVIAHPALPDRSATTVLTLTCGRSAPTHAARGQIREIAGGFSHYSNEFPEPGVIFIAICV